MTVDLRRFEYALEPLLRQRRWQLDALEARLGRATREIRTVEERLDELRARFRGQSEQVTRALASRLDPASHPRVLDWLCRLRREIVSAEEGLAVLRRERAELAARCVAQRHGVELIERHREDCVAEFVREEQNRLASEADRDWLSRLHWRGLRGVDTPLSPPEEAAR